MNKLVFLFLVLTFFSCDSQTQSIDALQSIENQDFEKMNGLSLVSMNRLLEASEVPYILRSNANWTSVIPFAFLPSQDAPGLTFNSEWQWKGERIDGAKNAIQLMHENGVSVMLKPQIWVGHGVFTGKIEMQNEKDWKQLEDEYGSYILTFAKLAEEEKVEMICIGTEMHEFAVQRADFWKSLIKDLREIYSGKLTYAENWDCYSEVSFWTDLDFIGIDAYFPIAEGNNPSEGKLREAWDKLESEFSEFSTHVDMQIVFTEYGYRSIANCAEAPWNYKSESKISERAQERALSALYDAIWDKPYFAGGFLWKWYPDHEKAGGSKNNMFTVQNKAAEKLVREVYGRK